MASFSMDFQRPVPSTMEFKIDVPNATGGEKVFKVRARCWDRQLFVVPSDSKYEPKKSDISLVEDPLAIPRTLQRKEVEDGGDANGGAAAVAGSGGKRILSALQGKERQRRIVLSFPEPVDGGPGDEGRPYDPIKITVGCIELNDPARGSAGTFEIVAPPAGSDGAEYFSMDNAKGAPKPGEEIEISFTFEPVSLEQSERITVIPSRVKSKLTEKSSARARCCPPPCWLYFQQPQADLDPACVVVGQWKEVVYQCVLSGGFVPEGEDPTETVEVVVKGFITS